jgi:NitT/TauT family transport system substrate-binding protein
MRRIFCAALALALAAASAQAATKLTMNFTTGESVTAFAAKEEGIFAKQGLDVDLVAVTQNSNAPAALESGSVQIGMIQVANLLQATDNGLDFVAIAGGSDLEKGVTHNSVVVRAGLPVTDAKGLVGRKVGVPGIGASIDIFFRTWLLDSDVDPARLTIAETTFLAMADNLKSGTLDAVTPLEPFVTRIVSAGIGFELVNLSDRLPKPRLNALLFVAKRDWAAQNAATIAALRAAIVEADDFVRANPAKSRGDINKYTQMPMAILNTLPLPTVDPQARADDFAIWAQMMTRLHMLQNKPDTARLILPPG